MKKRAKERRDAFSVYVGPTIPGVVQEGTIFPEPREETARKFAERFPDRPGLLPLIVDSDALARALADVKKPGTALGHSYKKAAMNRGKEGE